MFFARVLGEMQLERPHFGETNLLEEFFEVAQRILGDLRPKGQALRLRDVPRIIHQLVSDLWGFALKGIWMDGEGVDDQVLSINISVLTVAVPLRKFGGQMSPPHFVQVQRGFAPRPSFGEEQLATSPDGRVAELEGVLFVRGYDAHRRPADHRVCVLVPGHSEVGIVVVQVAPYHLDGHGPDAVAGVQELSGLVVSERFDEDVGHGADVIARGLAGDDERLVRCGEVDFTR